LYVCFVLARRIIFTFNTDANNHTLAYFWKNFGNYMAYKRKTWAEKMHPGFEPVVEITKKKFADVPEGVRMLVATPQVAADYIRHIPLGTHTSLQQMRKDLAASYNADYCCPITSGIFLRILSEAEHEAFINGKPVDQLVPFWRMIDHKSPICKKLTFGTDFIKEQRQKEGLPF
jgi:hypothetical protein